MEFRTTVEIDPPKWRIEPTDSILCLGSCFAQRVGRRMAESRLQATVNPTGTLYNPASIAMELKRATAATSGAAAAMDADVLVLTLGTSHVYMRDGVVVANCQKLPARLFTERELEVDEMVESLCEVCRGRRVIVTVSPYRYAKYGFHGSQLSKARLLLAADELTRRLPDAQYFPAYEIVLDELRDYRFFDADMLHPSQQAVDYIWERFAATMLTPRCQQLIAEMEPVRKALNHKPFNPESAEYRQFVEEARRKEKEIMEKYKIKNRNAL